MTKPVLLQIAPLPEWDEDPLSESFEIVRLFAQASKTFPNECSDLIKAIATRGDQGVPNEIIEACPALEIISVYGVGYDRIDIENCRARGIHVTNTPDVLTGDVADMAIALALATARQLPRAEAWVRDGSWASKGKFQLTHRLHGRKAGILGFGRIGSSIAMRLTGFEMEIAYADLERKQGADSFKFFSDPVSLAEWADVLFVALAASNDSKAIVNAEVLDALGEDGILINISRASNVDEPALLDALERGLIAGAGLDVFQNEPAIDPRFIALENVVLQPHHASGTVETRRAMGQLMRDNLTAHFAGEPLLTPVT